MADFIGNANFISAKVEEIEGRRITVRLQERIIVVESEEPQLQYFEGEEVYLAIKPEAISISREKTDFCGRIDLRSFLGAYTEYRIEFEGSFINIHQLNKGEKIESYRTGDRVQLKFDRDLFHIYKK